MDEHEVLCKYCGRVITGSHKVIEGVPVVKVIYTNGNQVEMKFCSEECAAYRQFSAEG